MNGLHEGMERLADAVGQRVAAGEAPCESGELYDLLTTALAGDDADSVAAAPVGEARPATSSVTRRADAPTGGISGRVRIHRRAAGSDGRLREQARDVVSDLRSLAEQSGRDANILVYFTDDEMTGYLDGPPSRMRRLFRLHAGESNVLEDELVRVVGQGNEAMFRPITVGCLARRDYLGGFSLRVWAVTAT